MTLLILTLAVGGPILAATFGIALWIKNLDNTDLRTTNTALKTAYAEVLDTHASLIETNEQLHRSLRNEQSSCDVFREWFAADMALLLEEGEQR